MTAPTPGTEPRLQVSAEPPEQWQPRSMEQLTRFTPPAPLGIGPQISGASMAELGAVIASAGAEKGAVTALLHNIQALAVKVSVEALPNVLSDMQSLHKARLMRLMQEVQAVPGVIVNQAQTWGDRIAGRPAVSTEYVSKDLVLRMIAAAMDRSVQTT